MNYCIEATPAYGRDYKSASTVKAAWAQGKDFRNAMTGQYLSIRDTVPGTVWVRYSQLRKVVQVK